MSLAILSNSASLLAQRNLSKTQEALSSSITRLSSGLKINSASDNSAGLAISQSMQSNADQLAPIGNANDAVNAASVADGALSSVTDNLQRMVALAQQSTNGTASAEQVDNINAEFSRIKAATLSIAGNTTFNGVNLLDLDSGTTKTITADTAQLDLGDIALVSKSNPEDGILTRSRDGFSLTSDTFDISSASSLEQRVGVVKALKSLIDDVSTARATVGSFQSEANGSIANISDKALGLYTQSRSSIMDIDVAQETANLALIAIRQQAAVSVLSQANSMPQIALSLLRG